MASWESHCLDAFLLPKIWVLSLTLQASAVKSTFQGLMEPLLSCCGFC